MAQWEETSALCAAYPGSKFTFRVLPTPNEPAAVPLLLDLSLEIENWFLKRKLFLKRQLAVYEFTGGTSVLRLIGFPVVFTASPFFQELFIARLLLPTYSALSLAYRVDKSLPLASSWLANASSSYSSFSAFVPVGRVVRFFIFLDPALDQSGLQLLSRLIGLVEPKPSLLPNQRQVSEELYFVY